MQENNIFLAFFPLCCYTVSYYVVMKFKFDKKVSRYSPEDESLGEEDMWVLGTKE